MNRIAPVLSIAMALTANAALASTLPQVFQEKSHRFEDKVYGYARIQKDQKNQPVIRVLFSHSKKFRGERGLGVTARLMSRDQIVAMAAIDRVVHDPKFKGTREVAVVAPMKLDPEVWAKVTHVEYDFRGYITQAQFNALQGKFMNRPTPEQIKPGAAGFPAGSPEGFNIPVYRF